MKDRPQSNRLFVGGTAAALLILGLAAYAPTLRFEYVQDAHYAIERNPVVHRGDPVEIFLSHYWKETPSQARTLYRPVAVGSFAVEYAIRDAADPWLSHLVNVLIHLLSAMLLLLYVRRLGGTSRAAAVSALLFAVHPVLMQPVANVAGRADLLAVLFSLATLLCFTAAGPWRRGQPSAVAQRAASWGGGLLLFLALGSKESAIAVPLLLLAQEFLFRPAGERRGAHARLSRVTALAPAALALFGYVLLRARAIEELVGAQRVLPMDNVLVGLEGVPRLATALAMAGRYLLLLVFPRTLSGDYSGAVIARESSLLAPLAGLGLLGLVAVASLALLPTVGVLRGGPVATHRSRVAMAAWIFLLPYLVVGNLLVLNGAGFAERLIYFPAVGFCMMLGLGAVALHERFTRTAHGWTRAISPLLLALLLLGAAAHVRGQSRMWQSDEVLSESTLRATPRSLRAQLTLADLRRKQGRIDEAIALYERSLESSPDHGPSWGRLGLLLLGRGEVDRAEAALRRCTALRPEFAEPHMYLGLALERQGKLAEAERALRRAAVVAPALTEARTRAGDVALKLGIERGRAGDLSGAEAALRRAVEVRPLSARRRLLLGNALASLGRLGEAEDDLREALRLNPGSIAAAERLGHVLFQSGRYREAADQYRHCVEHGRDDLRRFLREAETRAATGSC